MWENILDIAIANGLFAALFVALFIYMIKDSTKRENRYQQTISDLTTRLGIVKDVKDSVIQMKQNVSEIKQDVEEVKYNVKEIKSDVEGIKDTLKTRRKYEKDN